MQDVLMLIKTDYIIDKNRIAMHKIQGCGVEVGVGLLRVQRVGIGIFYPTSTPDVQFF